VKLAQELTLTQTPLGQEAPAGQASTGVQVQVLVLAGFAAPALTVTPPGLPLH
jgi:hypothetical protein